MALKAVLFGSIGTVVDSSEIQREAYNRAFAEMGLDWHWSRASYRAMLAHPAGHNGADRIREYAQVRGETVSPALIHRRKVAHFVAMAHRLRPREGLREVVAGAKAAGLMLGFVPTTSPDQVSLTLRIADRAVKRRDFRFVCDDTMVAREKPHPEAYFLALSELGIAPTEALAIEDTPECARAAMAAGIPVVGAPGAAARHRLFPAGVHVMERLDPQIILAGVPAARVV